MRRFPGTLLGPLLVTLLVAHAGVLISGWSTSGPFLTAAGFDWVRNAQWLGASLGVALIGRLFLALLPPGEPGFHDPRHLPATWATSLGLGALAGAWLWAPLVRASQALTEPGSLASRWLGDGLALGGFLGLLALRWLSLPGAMAPRHSVERSTGRWGWLVAGLVFLWLAAAFVRPDFAATLVWLALALLLERGLACARRAALARALFFLTLVSLPAMAQIGRDELPGLHGVGLHGVGPHGVGPHWAGLRGASGVAFALGAGSAFLIPWLRRADKRAGVLAALFFGGAFLRGWDPLALAGPLVLVLASRRAQRGFALRVALGTLLAGGTVGLALGPSPAARERLLQGGELWRAGLEPGLWGLAWPLVLVGLLLGAVRFPWRAPLWSPGAIEAPRREGLALLALIGTAAAALALPCAPWDEQEALVILFPPTALLAGLWLFSSERPAG